MLVAKNKRYEVACDRFLATHPVVQAELDRLAVEDSTDDINRLRASTLYNAFAEEAESEGLDSVEFALKILADSPEELQAMRDEYQREIDEALRDN
ncbi:hypothetical protein EDC56_2048 [Sinobacterium caligoides]|uniref:Uncharacterized protein n=1 Tax=Sinobacterium caligoides TaxID=933926 RepID=A0A3N2DP66_9GAMM|nr:DUF6388 family protein [Sinobacterium caligoides]ROS01604.1 hypothetical protein EDC56_2048 [Sinobacterium caligoides]